MSRKVSIVAALVLLLLASHFPAQAQPRGAPRPDHAVQVKLGGFFPSGGGDLWNENEQVFTQDISDFDDFVFGLSFVTAVNNYVEIGVNVDFYDAVAFSRYRTGGNFGVFHDTVLEEVPLTADLRWFPGGRYRIRAGGRRVAKPAFYLGAGIGANFWEYEEVGEFFDFRFDPPEIFFDRFQDTGTAFQAQLSAGVELPLNPGFSIVFEGRHAWADDELGQDFAGFGTVELGGTSLFAGGAFRF